MIKDSLQVVKQKVQERWGDNVLSVVEFRDELTVRVKPVAWYEFNMWLRDDPDCAFNLMIDETAADFPLREDRFDVICHLYSIDKAHRIRTKTSTAEHIPSLVQIWRTANWLERETYDLFGIIFDGHPDLRRIMMPTNWEGYPLRKDYPVEGYDM